MTGKIFIAGCGALGSQIALHLALPEREFLLVDDEHIGPENIGTSAYWMAQVGAYKAQALAEMLWRKAGAKAVPDTGTLTHESLLFRGRDRVAEIGLLVDTFDNAQSRGLLCGLRCPTLHVGVSERGTGMAVWDEEYKLPEDETPRGSNPVCTHQLGRGLLRWTAAVGAGIAEQFLENGLRRRVIVTADMKILE